MNQAKAETADGNMITDPLFYRLFETSPETFFLLLGIARRPDQGNGSVLSVRGHRVQRNVPSRGWCVLAEGARLAAVIYQLAGLSREEIQTMLQVHDIRETRVYQEALEEGKALGLQEGIALAIAKMAAKQIPAEEIAAILEVNIELVRQVINHRTNS